MCRPLHQLTHCLHYPQNPTAATTTTADDIERSISPSEERPWTLTHSWYAIMGGYSYNLRQGTRVFLPDDQGRQRVVLRDEALRFVAVHAPAAIPPLAEATILDKSSAGTFVKILALFQALWFSLQCIARMGQGLSLSLLELTTFAHCVVALIIGWLWLRKPLDIREPDPLVIPTRNDSDEDEDEDDDDEKDDGATVHWLMAMLYTLTSFDSNEEADEDKWRKLTPGQTARFQAVSANERNDKDAAVVDFPVYLQPVGDHGPLSFAELGWDHSRPNTTSSRPVTALTAAASPRSPLAVLTPAKTSPAQSLSEMIQSAADAEARLRIRMALAQKGWEHYILNTSRPSSPAAVPSDTPMSPNEAKGQQQQQQEEKEEEEEQDPHVLQQNLKRTLRNTLCDRVHNFPRGRHQPTTQQYQSHHSHSHSHSHHHHPRQQQQQQDEQQVQPKTTTEQHRHTVRTHLGITLAGFLYGGLHLLAWDATFTTPAERTLWRIAALSLAASGLLVPVSHAEGYVADAVRPWLAMDEADRDAEEAAHLRAKAQEMLLLSSSSEGGLAMAGGGGGGEGEGKGESWRWWSRKWAWKVYRWCFLWMVEVARVLRVAMLVVVALVYFGLRVFVFLECLVNLVHLPASAYEVVKWSQYVPHIS